jgi:hypothetical protein
MLPFTLLDQIREQRQDSIEGRKPKPASALPCPYCKADNNFRQPELSEDVRSLLGYGTRLVAKFKASPADAASEVSRLVGSGTGSFGNYICRSCNGRLNRCGGCKQMIPYEDVPEKCPACGYT